MTQGGLEWCQRWAHNPENVGSNPTPATKFCARYRERSDVFPEGFSGANPIGFRLESRYTEAGVGGAMLAIKIGSGSRPTNSEGRSRTCSAGPIKVCVGVGVDGDTRGVRLVAVIPEGDGRSVRDLR